VEILAAPEFFAVARNSLLWVGGTSSVPAAWGVQAPHLRQLTPGVKHRQIIFSNYFDSGASF
jgi:hypothetical protein